MWSKTKIRSNKLIALPYNRLYRLSNGEYLDFEIEGVGSKVFLAQLAQEYSTIGIDGVAMAVNDTIRSGSTPILLAD
jgi:phosphoribosylaminoimidazole (AIR) synthetase